MKNLQKSLRSQLFFLSLLVCALLSSKNALSGPLQFASQAGFSTPPNGVTPWLSKEYPDCGQSCLYTKAAENIMLQADYLSGKIEILKELQTQLDAANNNNDQATVTTIKNEMIDTIGAFCFSNEDGANCTRRYVHTHGLVLLSMQKAIALNKDLAFQHEDNRTSTGIKNVRPEFNIQHTNNKEFEKLKVLLPHLPSYDELQKMDLEFEKEKISRKLKPFTKADYQAWANDLLERPKPGDDLEGRQLFIQSAAVTLREHTTPSWMIERDAKGHAKFDAKAYKQVVNSNFEKLYEKKRNPITGRDDPSIMESYVKDIKNDLDRAGDHLKKDRKTQWNSNGSHTEDVYHAVQGANVDAVNTQFVGSGFSKEVQFSKQSNPAGITSGQASVTSHSKNKKVRDVLIKDTLKKGKNQTASASASFTLEPNLYTSTIENIYSTWKP